jgi:hypothetical protein
MHGLVFESLVINLNDVPEHVGDVGSRKSVGFVSAIASKSACASAYLMVISTQVLMIRCATNSSASFLLQTFWGRGAAAIAKNAKETDKGRL